MRRMVAPWLGNPRPHNDYEPCTGGTADRGDGRDGMAQSTCAQTPFVRRTPHRSTDETTPLSPIRRDRAQPAGTTGSRLGTERAREEAGDRIIDADLTADDS